MLTRKDYKAILVGIALFTATTPYNPIEVAEETANKLEELGMAPWIF